MTKSVEPPDSGVKKTEQVKWGVDRFRLFHNVRVESFFRTDSKIDSLTFRRPRLSGSPSGDVYHSLFISTEDSLKY